MVATHNKSSCFLDACRKKPTSRTPVWFMRQAGRYMPEYRKLREKYDLLTLCKTPELATEVTLQPIKALDVDAAILFADLLLPLEPLGIPFRFAAGEGPVIETPIQSKSDVEKLRPVVPEESLSYVLHAIGFIQNSLQGRIPLIGFAGAPFTLASYLIEGGHSQNFLKTKSFMAQQPDAWDQLLRKLSKVTGDFLQAQIRAGADAVQIFDSWAGVLSPSDYRKSALPYTQQIVRQLSALNVPIIYFSTGTGGMLDCIKETEADCISIDWRTQLDKSWDILGPSFSIQGNLDPTTLFAPLPYLKSEVESILKMASGRHGHIFNLGHGILPETPVDHVKAVVDWVKGASR